MSDRFTWTEPVLCTYNYDLSRPWFVYFDYTDTLTQTTIRRQFRGPINKKHTKEERILYGKALKEYWKLQLKTGWNPFEEKGDIPMVRPRIDEAFKLILELKAMNCGKRTMESYRHVVKLFLEWLSSIRLDHIFAQQFTIHHARMYMDHLGIKKGYSGRTYNDHLRTLSTFFNSMIEREWVDKSPFRKIKRAPVTVGRNIAFSDEERELLKTHLYNNDRPMYYFTQFVYYCYIRRSELTRLKIENIDFVEGTIIIPSAASKNKKQESVVIPASFVDIIHEMNLRSLPKNWYIFGRRMKPGPDQYVNYNHISTRHNTIAKELGIETDRGLYSWKHSGVCKAYYATNGDIYSIMRQCRHSDISTTQIYLKSLGLVDNSVIREARW